ncbi:MAG: hypothetical protein IJW54_05940 [Clostridia bacterium]|nr:hypothetical protein [Clostridia bacterium]
MLTIISDLVAKRKQLWEEKHDIEFDARVVSIIADKILDTPELTAEIKERPWLLIECCFSLVDKKKRNVPFFYNEVQRDFIEQIETKGRSKPFFVLKGRQQGFTTIITAIQLAHAIVRRNFSGFTLADRDDNTKAIFIDKAKVMYNALPDRLKPHEKLNSVNELFFDKLNSSWRVASATSNVGRSRTLSFIHYSEIAFFRCNLSDLQKSIQEAAIEDALCVYETTANGFNEAKDLWDSGACHNLFYEWWRTKEYVSNESEYLYLMNADEWLTKRLKALREKGLNDEQLTWYAKKYHSYIDKTAIRQEYPCTPEEAFVSSGNCIFDKDAISNYLSTYDVKSRLGYFEYEKKVRKLQGENGEILGYEEYIDNYKFVEDKNGYISIVEEPYIEEKKGTKRIKPYVIGADTAGTGIDYFTAKVIDNTCGRCVATFHKQRIDEDLFAEQLYCLGKYYNDALIGIETNYSRHPVRVLRKLGYSNLYVSKKLTTSADIPEGFYGFVTSSITRPIIISNLVSIMRENVHLETDRETLKEMTTFIKRDDGKHAAADGAHDDLVMASAIAHYIAIDYEHSIKDLKNDFDALDRFFNSSVEENSYMEW